MCSGRSTRWTSRRAAALRAVVPALVLALALPLQARSALDIVAVRATEPALLDVESGGTATTSFLVSNHSDGRIELLETIALPRGWDLIIGGSSFTLAPREERLRLVVFRAPVAAPASSYALAYEVTGSSASGAYGREEVQVTVPARDGLEITTADVQARVIAGRALAARLTIANLSNVARVISLRASSSEGFAVEPHALSFALGPGERRDVTASVATPEDIEEPMDHVLRVEVTAEAPEMPLETATAAIVQELLPRISGTYDRYNRVPGVLKLVYVGSHDRSGVQVEFAGRGGMDDANSRRIDFLFRGPGTKDDSIFGLREEYGLGLAGDSYEVRLGDGLYEFSRLTGHRRRGRGASVNAGIGPVSVGAVYYRTRSWQPQADRSAARLEYARGTSFSAGLNCVRTWRRDGDIVSLDVSGEPVPWLEIALEYAGQALVDERQAYWVRARGSRGGARYFFERARAGSEFTGHYSNELHTTGSLSVPVFASGRLTGLWRSYRNGGDAEPLVSPDGEPLLSSTTREFARTLAFKTALFSGFRASAACRCIRRAGTSSTSEFEYATNTASVGLEHAGPRISAVGFVEFGHLRDTTDGIEGDVRRYSMTLGLRPAPGWRLSGHFTSALSGSPDPSNRSDIVGLDIEAAPLDALTLSASAQWREPGERTVLRPDHLTARVECELVHGHRIACEARRTVFEDRAPESAVRLSYHIPIQTPVTRRRDTGAVRGTVTDSEHPERVGLADVILAAGDVTAVTDETGEYVFPSLEPGEHELTVDPSTIGFDRVTTSLLPRRLEVAGGEELHVDLGVVRSGRVEGEVIAGAASPGGQAGSRQSGSCAVPPLIVEMSNDACVLKQMTDVSGRFCFDGLCPGRWVLTINREALPRFQTLSRDTFVLEVHPGSTTSVTATVESNTGSIPIIDTGGVRTSSLDG